ncbi:unnamed protein product [Vitrella brassicaformis CCMP3155]|uniref:Uncharacterized protein n=1 Tax=Vitrella brassicaformis (strain CCMP3155) TaxID=1169540 RepID=A0A0G4FXW6_VITBC|nr:unnamed protein product [Vitrella brassicaformis CCMP3155]|mmetsp:Transcript_9240/g.26658  ORF Transcript_9240/g.26658 Transcript_9240/m.26658 type:complete len:312 (-) Transcript_9240:1230-2165(-)|eukprot:CEM20269.1 unnamed protein product [Vitrella brassicaformis CCMP3155]
MGGDGGSIPGRADMIRTAGYKFARNLGGMGYTPNTQVRAGDEKYDTTTERRLRWGTCAVSQEKLSPPVVACRLGQLYNKEALLRRLLDKTLPPNAEHIRGSRDFREVGGEWNSSTGRLVCPITRVDMDGNAKGVLVWKCGCVLSDKALKQFGNESKNHNHSSSNTKEGESKQQEDGTTTDSKKCLSCGAVYTDEDLVCLVPTEDELKANRQKIDAIRAKNPKTKKAKAAAAAASNDTPAPNGSAAVESKKRPAEPANSAPPAPPPAAANGEVVPSAAKKARVGEGGEGMRSHLEGKSDVYKSLFVSSKGRG